MFVHESHMPQLLAPGDYTSQEQYELELEHAFRPAWQCIGTLSDLPREGDYLTFELYGEPLIAWNSGGEVHTFLNVCPHRFSRIKPDACGHAGERLVCQYHGWEFDETGCTRKIPDARSFKPMEKGALGLKKYRTEVCGQAIFVTLSDDAPDLEAFLGPGYDVCRDLCSADRTVTFTLDFEVDNNWKCKIENALESYHVDLIHPTTFGKTPDAELCFHEMQPNWTKFSTRQQADSRLERFLDRAIHRLARVEMDDEYRHYIYYPNIMLGKMRLFTWIELILPVGPSRSRIFTKYFCYAGRSGRLRSRLLLKALAHWQKKFFTKVTFEDAGILAEVQQGLNSQLQPSTGVISVREERCFHFQEWIKTATQTGRPAREPVPVGGGS